MCSYTTRSRVFVSLFRAYLRLRHFSKAKTNLVNDCGFQRRRWPATLWMNSWDVWDECDAWNCSCAPSKRQKIAIGGSSLAVGTCPTRQRWLTASVVLLYTRIAKKLTLKRKTIVPRGTIEFTFSRTPAKTGGGENRLGHF